MTDDLDILRHESALLGAVMCDHTIMDKFADSLSWNDFVGEDNRKVYYAMKSLWMANTEIDLLTLSDFFKKNVPEKDRVGSFFISGLATTVPSASNWAYYVGAIREEAKRRKLLEIKNINEEQTPEQILKQIDDIVYQVSVNMDRSYKSMSVIMTETREHMAATVAHKTIPGSVPSGLERLDRLTCGFQPTDLVIIAGRPGKGKAQPLSSKVLTPKGFKKMGDISVGDEIYGINGKINKVVGIYPQGIVETYKVTLSDGSEARCTLDHLWFTQTRAERRKGLSGSVKTTKEIIATLKRSDGADRNHVVPVSSAFEFYWTTSLFLNPWLLGALIGDGRLSDGNILFSKPEKDIQEKFLSLLPGPDCGVVNGMDIRVKRKKKNNDQSETKKVISYYKLDVLSEYKFIPGDYLMSSRKNRLDLLRGLLDTDGYVYGNRVEYSTSSKRLSDDVMFLVRSLGGLCHVKPKKTTYTYNGVKKSGLISYRMIIWFKDDTIPVSSEKHLKKFIPNANRIHRSIVKIERDRRDFCQCIMVDDPDGIYITDDFIPTHNTTLATNKIAPHAAKLGVPVGIFSLEMSRIQLVMRMLSCESGVDYNKLRAGTWSESEGLRLKTARQAIENLPIHIDDEAGVRISSLKVKAKAMKMKENIGLLIIDYLQLIDTDDISGSRNDQISSVSRQLKAIAKSLNIPVIVLSQLSRAVEQRGGEKRPQLSDLRDSGAIEQDADTVIFVHNDDDGKGDGSLYYKPIPATLIVAKQRNGPIGDVKLDFIKNIMKFTE